MAKLQGADLFPILPQQLTGIARMAALAEHADDGHLIEFKALPVRSILNNRSRSGCAGSPTASTRTGAASSAANTALPARHTSFWRRYHQLRTDMDPLPDRPMSRRHGQPPSNEIYLKQNAAWLLEQELRIDPRVRSPSAPPPIPTNRSSGAHGSRAHPAGLCQAIRIPIGIITKSRLIVRDLDLLRRSPDTTR